MVFSPRRECKRRMGEVAIKFYLTLFLVPRVARLRVEILTFTQKEKESLGVAWACLTDLVSSCPDLAIAEPTLLQHFYLSLSKDSVVS